MATPSAQPVLLLAALRDEMLPTVRRLRLARRDAVTFAGQVGGTPVLARIGGCGGPRIVASIELALAGAAIAPRLLLFGFAGALSPHLHVGDVLHPQWIVDAHASSWLIVEGSPPVVAPPPPMEMSRTLLTIDRVATTPADKVVLHRRHAAAAVDMESHHVAAFAAGRGLPLTVIRAISDDADTTLPAGMEQWINDDGSPRVSRALVALLRRPTMLASLLRLRRDTQRAAENLATAVEQWLATK